MKSIEKVKLSVNTPAERVAAAIATFITETSKDNSLILNELSGLFISSIKKPGFTTRIKTRSVCKYLFEKDCRKKIAKEVNRLLQLSNLASVDAREISVKLDRYINATAWNELFA